MLAPITASAIVAAVGDGRQFQSARHIAAWLGIDPKDACKREKKRGSGKDKLKEVRPISAGASNPWRKEQIVGTLFRKNVDALVPVAACPGGIRRPTKQVSAVAVAHKKTARALCGQC